jgi:gas vesicle protein
MADQDFRSTDKNPSSSASHGFEGAASGTKSAADQALSAGRDLRDKAMDMAGSSTEAIKDHASDFVDAAKDVASQAKDRLKETVEDRKDAGGEYVGSLADTMRRAAHEFDNDLPIAGTYIRKAASQVEVVSDLIKNGSFDDLMHSAQNFARRQPTAFLGMAVLAGFGVVRLLKSSAETSEGGSRVSGEDPGARSYPRARRADNEGYRDGLTK